MPLDRPEAHGAANHRTRQPLGRAASDTARTGRITVVDDQTGQFGGHGWWTRVTVATMVRFRNFTKRWCEDPHRPSRQQEFKLRRKFNLWAFPDRDGKPYNRVPLALRVDERVLNEPVLREPDPDDASLERRYRPTPEFDGRVLRVIVNATVEPLQVMSVFSDRSKRVQL